MYHDCNWHTDDGVWWGPNPAGPGGIPLYLDDGRHRDHLLGAFAGLLTGASGSWTSSAGDWKPEQKIVMTGTRFRHSAGYKTLRITNTAERCVRT